MKQIIVEREDGSIRVMIKCEGPSLTEQSHRGSTNINKIVAKYKKTGFLASNAREARYGDFSSAEDFHTIENRINEAQDDFMRLPAKLRNRFNNDPGELIDFISDENNRQEAYELGLVLKPVVNEVPDETPPVEPPVEP